MVLALGDSSFLSFPEVNDFLLMTFSIDHPGSMVKYAGMTVLGSVLGCAMLYYVGRAGGEALLRRKFADARLLKVRSWYSRYGILAIIIPSLLPPPMPFKVFVLSAGTFGISWPRFVIAVVIGRGIRYFSEGILAVEYGPAAFDFVHANYGKIGIVTAVAIVLTVVAATFVRRRRLRSIEI
jgi:membrane protein YqaA with SNARE-associated domain